MEALHAARFLLEVLSINPNLSMSTWAEFYRDVSEDPRLFPCGCPNQVREVGQDGEDHLGET